MTDYYFWHHKPGIDCELTDKNYATIYKERDALRERAGRYEKALQSIAKNSCCKPCREAGLVAKAALSIPEGER